MTPLQAEKLVYEWGELIEKSNGFPDPENYSKNLRNISRNEFRRAIMLWVAQQKFEGHNILNRFILSRDGNKVAILELAVNMWHLTRLFRVSEKTIRDGTAEKESKEDYDEAIKKWDEFQNLILKLDSSDSNYWEKILTKTELNKIRSSQNFEGQSNKIDYSLFKKVFEILIIVLLIIFIFIAAKS